MPNGIGNLDEIICIPAKTLRSHFSAVRFFCNYNGLAFSNPYLTYLLFPSGTLFTNLLLAGIFFLGFNNTVIDMPPPPCT